MLCSTSVDGDNGVKALSNKKQYKPHSIDNRLICLIPLSDGLVEIYERLPTGLNPESLKHKDNLATPAG